MENKYIWAIEDIFSSTDEWHKTFNEIKNQINFDEYKGQLNNPDKLFDYLKALEKVSRVVDRLYVYAMMKHDEDTANAEYDALLSRITTLSVQISEKTAFFLPELTSLDVSRLKEYMENPKLKDYDYTIKSILREKEHVLSESEERLLSLASEPLSSFREIFTKTDNADLPLGTITHKGEKIPLSHGTYGVIMHGEDRELRKKAYKKYYKAYGSLINVISATYYGSVKKDVFGAKARKYQSALDKALIGEDVSPVVYQNLLQTVGEALPMLHDYVKERKNLLGLDKMYMYDMYVPTVADAEMKLEYEDAYQLVIDGLSVLGEEYVDLLKRAKDERWLHVYEGKGKRSGAYSVAVYDTHPYVLLNYQKTTHDIFTIAHEMGHSIHSYFSNLNQPYSKADYTIFVAEVASTVNEVLLIRYLLKVEKDERLRKYLLSYLLEMIRTTLFRQTQFAEFESKAHSLVEEGEPLTKELLSSVYLELNKKYYGSAVISDDLIKLEWARIPHFYRAFYVYKYATGIISALAIADRILNEGKTAVDDYFKFLSSGSSDGPIELLKIAGVDLTKRQPFESAFKVFEDTLKEFKQMK